MDATLRVTIENVVLFYEICHAYHQVARAENRASNWKLVFDSYTT